MASCANSSERTLQLNYWKEHSIVPSVEAMMLDSQASKLDQEERPEILSLLPPFNGKSIIELGAGIGRFTGELAKTAGHVLAMDFMDNLIKKNEEVNGHYKNTEFKCADVTALDLKIPEASADIVFSNWLLMYLSDHEVEDLARNTIRWLKLGGYIFFRESCFHQSGDHKRKNNPTHYRQPSFYTKVFEQTHFQEEDGTYTEYQLVGCKCVGAYVRNKKNQNQVCWLWQKVEADGPEGKSFQRFLDTVQYTETGILRYERIFGKGFVSTGGLETTKEFVKKLELKEGDRVLDVGCGIGGGDFYMAEEYDVEVVGIDLSINMISLALERSIGRKCAIEFEVGDCTKMNFPPSSFDVIYSRDTILHIQDKPTLFKKFYEWLKPGGRLLISDYCRSPSTPSPEFAAYIDQRGYDLHSVEHYGQMLEDAGFENVQAEDQTTQFIEVLNKELTATAEAREKFIEDFSEDDYNYIVRGWESKLKRCGNGEQKWGLFLAYKSTFAANAL
ncbi:unnamed protein product [Sphagnum jensenii]|uniref:phosphoethanolamine N-methyltransferase n=1 Tax=Sphagnum jensenii TaxID=128206 RepID=A0ABP0WRU8_9BRYO